MKKVMTIFGAILFASSILTCCGGGSVATDAIKLVSRTSIVRALDLTQKAILHLVICPSECRSKKHYKYRLLILRAFFMQKTWKGKTAAAVRQ